MSFPTSSLSSNTAPLPTAPPRPVRNSRGLRADTAAPLFKTNVYTHHGQVTLLPPPNMVRVRANRADDIAASSSSAVDVTEDTASSIRPRRRNKQQRTSQAGLDGREEIILKPGQTASEAIRAQYRRSEASMRAPPPASRPPPSSPSSAQQVRRARARAGTSGLTREASMMRRNVQEDIVAPVQQEDNSDITPPVPPPTYPVSLSSAAIRLPSEPSPLSDSLDPSPAYPSQPSHEQPSPAPVDPEAGPSQPIEALPVAPSSPPPTYALPTVTEEETAPSAPAIEPVAVTTEGPVAAESAPVVLEPLSLTRRIWDEMVREQIPFEERIKRMRAWENAGSTDEDENADEIGTSATAVPAAPAGPVPAARSSPPPPRPPPKTTKSSAPLPPSRPRIQPLASLPSFKWESEPILSFTIPNLATVEEHVPSSPVPAPSSPPPLPISPRRPLFSSNHDHLAPLLAARASSSPSVAGPSPGLNLPPSTSVDPQLSDREDVDDMGRLTAEANGSSSRPSSTEPPPLPPRPPANPPPAILLRLSRRRRPPPPPPTANRSSSPALTVRPTPPPPPPRPAPILNPIPEPAAVSEPVPPRRQSPPPPPSLSSRQPVFPLSSPPVQPVPATRPTPPPPPPSLSSRPPLPGHAASSSRLLALPRRVSEVSVATSSIFETPDGTSSASASRRSSSAELAALTRSSWSASAPDQEPAPRTSPARPVPGTGADGRPSWAARPLPRTPGSTGTRTPTTTEPVAAASTSIRADRVPTVQLAEQLPFEITDLDLLVSRLDQSTTEFDAAQMLDSFLSSSVPPHLTTHELSLLPHHLIVELSRRTTKAGKTKIKLAFGSSTDHPEEGTVRVDRCSFGCLSLFKAGEMAVGLKPGCGHVGHEGCAKRWFAGSRRCPVCRAEVEVGQLS